MQLAVNLRIYLGFVNILEYVTMAGFFTAGMEERNQDQVN
jgi:hypothetical protein